MFDAKTTDFSVNFAPYERSERTWPNGQVYVVYCTTRVILLEKRLSTPLLLIAVALINILVGGNGWFTVADIMFLLLLGGTVGARWVEFQGGNPQTADGEPATPAQLHRYMLIATIVGLSVWIVANFVANYLLA